MQDHAENNQQAETLARCAICGHEGRYIGVHVQKTHGLKPSAYTAQHPGHPLFASGVSFHSRTGKKREPSDPTKPKRLKTNSDEKAVLETWVGRPFERGVGSLAIESGLSEERVQVALINLIERGDVFPSKKHPKMYRPHWRFAHLEDVRMPAPRGRGKPQKSRPQDGESDDIPDSDDE